VVFWEDGQLLRNDDGGEKRRRNQEQRDMELLRANLPADASARVSVNRLGDNEVPSADPNGLAPAPARMNHQRAICPPALATAARSGLTRNFLFFRAPTFTLPHRTSDATELRCHHRHRHRHRHRQCLARHTLTPLDPDSAGIA
jgi:hypothetical protein